LRKNKGLPNGLGVLQVFTALGAPAGGFGLVLEPSGANLGIPLEALEHSPFSTYLVPGIVLFMVNGLGSLVGAAGKEGSDNQKPFWLRPAILPKDYLAGYPTDCARMTLCSGRSPIAFARAGLSTKRRTTVANPSEAQ